MTQNERDPEFAPHAAVSLRDQSSMLLALEELGIAHMQDAWIRANEPAHPDAAAVHEQAEEFRADIMTILSGKAGEDRVVAEGWAGAALASHLRKALASEISRKGADAAQLSDEAVIGAALDCYLADLALLTERDTREQMMGRKVPAKEYMDFMVGWSGVMCGKADTLNLPQGFLLYKGSRL